MRKEVTNVLKARFARLVVLATLALPVFMGGLKIVGYHDGY